MPPQPPHPSQNPTLSTITIPNPFSRSWSDIPATTTTPTTQSSIVIYPRSLTPTITTSLTTTAYTATESPPQTNIQTATIIITLLLTLLLALPILIITYILTARYIRRKKTLSRLRERGVVIAHTAAQPQERPPSSAPDHQAHLHLERFYQSQGRNEVDAGEVYRFVREMRRQQGDDGGYQVRY
ncbi:hypothetical protein QBC40DRAFT_249758 [Triangularia verruculosa]|uniref:Uncharacterized protein n=1 Tax=Triangularia verruculosa TaxID=2587418 RepID=A0AAN6XQJ4_9PEZI|nr:hypothetical protein QBC40DRAFT_249758 [Triangularia verruculosa]